MWRYLPGVSIPNKKDVKEIPQKADSREYEKTRSRKLSSKRQVGRPWLKDDENSMTCGVVYGKQTNLDFTERFDFE